MKTMYVIQLTIKNQTCYAMDSRGMMTTTASRYAMRRASAEALEKVIKFHPELKEMGATVTVSQ